MRLAMMMLALAGLAACGTEPEPAPERRSAAGEVLGGEVTDAMLPLDTVRSTSPVDGSAGAADGDRADEAGDANSGRAAAGGAQAGGRAGSGSSAAPGSEPLEGARPQISGGPAPDTNATDRRVPG